MLVPRIGHFQEIAANTHLENQIDNILELNIESMWSIPSFPSTRDSAYVPLADP
jgi:hypothetical protein